MLLRVRLAAPLLLLVGVAGGGCSSDDAAKPTVAVTLPGGSLADKVLQAEDVPDGLVPILAQTGTADVSRIAGFSADSAAAEKSLREHGFDDAYVVQYGDQKSGRFIVNVVSTFDSAEGAEADLTADLISARQTGTPFPVDDLGDQAGGVRAVRADPASASGAPSASGTPSNDFDLVTVRWRLGSTTWLLAVGARGTVEQDAVIKLARLVLARASA
ncbi:MAG TPA: hypothetical protein VNB94_00820 [Mycobacteriales bacterium]|nr:hypothetical protein [Mycobacteriales bacterium]